MSALGQKQTLKPVRVMSALPPKADIGTQSRNVRFVPKADIVPPSTPPKLRRRKSFSCEALAVNKKADGQRRNDKHDQKAAEYQSQPNTW
jgi:hypothetical protein